MKTSAITLFLISFISLLSAQTITKGKIIGKWKVSAIETHGKRITVTDVASIMQGFDPDGKLSKEEKELFKSMAEMIYSTMGSMIFEFKSNDSVYMSIGLTIEGKTKIEKEVSAYSVRDNKLTMNMAGDKKEDMEIAMPDPQTLVFTNFDDRDGRNLILKKQ